MAKINPFVVLFISLLLVIEYANCVPFFEHPPLNIFPPSPFDAWRNSLPPLSPHGIRESWPNYYNFPLPDSSFDDDAETVSGPELRTEKPTADGNREPFDIDVITSDIPQNTDTGVFFQQSIPFFDSHPFFSTFGGFGIGSRREPWWKGQNVCTNREEDEETTDQDEIDGEDEVESATDLDVKPSQFFSGFQFSVNSCVEKQSKHVCKKIFSQQGKKKTLTVTRQCCHGYGRPRNADVTIPCEKIEIKSIPEVAESMGAKEFVRSAKNNGLEEKLASNVTIFMPTDAAFTDFSEQMFENNLVVLPLRRSRRATDPSGITTRDLILSHMVDGWIDMEDVSNEDLLTSNYQNTTIRINIFPRPPSSKDNEYPFRYTANCAPIVKLNQMSTNGIVHAIDRVLTPSSMSVMDIIRQRSDMAVLRTILEKTKLSELLEGTKPVTIFAPTDEAFEKLEMHLRRTLKEGKGCAANILRNHILDLTFCSVAVVLEAKTTAYNLLGQSMTLSRSAPTEENSKGSEVTDMIGMEDIVVNGMAKIIEADLMGTNGVIHVVDSIMPTESALPVTSLMQKKNLTIFKRLVEASALGDEFDDMDNVTIFAPIDKAFDNSVWKKRLEEDPEHLKDDPELKDFLSYHVVRPMTKTCDLSEKLIPTVAGSDLRVNLYSTHALFTNVMNRATVNCARLIHFDDESCGSVLHQVEKVLTPPKKTLLEQLKENPNYSNFLDLVKSANLTDLLKDYNQSYTLLIPKNDVFEEVQDWEKNLSQNKSELENIVKTHIVNDVVCCAGIIPTNWPFVRTIESINNHHLRIGRDRRPKVENAGITKCDIVATNGILHEINDVIIPRKRHNTNRHHNVDTFHDIFY